MHEVGIMHETSPIPTSTLFAMFFAQALRLLQVVYYFLSLKV